MNVLNKEVYTQNTSDIILNQRYIRTLLGYKQVRQHIT